MERLSGLDASFLYLESDTQPMNVVGIVEVDPTTIPGGYDFDSFRAEMARRVTAMPKFRRKLHKSVLNLDHPAWVEATDFDIERHVHHVALPSPGGDRELADFCSHLAALPLDRARPLWELWVIEGRPDGRLAVMLRVHHALADGNGGAEVIGQLCSPTPEPPALDQRLVAQSAGVAPLGALVFDGAVNAISRPLHLARMVGRSTKVSVNWLAASLRNAAMPAPFSAPRTPLNGSVSAHRAVAFTQVSIDDVARIKHHFGVTVNDVVLAVAAGALREHLITSDTLPATSLVAMVPVSVNATRQDVSVNATRQDVSVNATRQDERIDDRTKPTRVPQGSNLVTGMFVRLPTTIADPVERMYAMAQMSVTAKRHHSGIDPHLLQGWAELMPPNIARLLGRVYGANDLAERHRVIYNLVVSNVRGPRQPQYFLGARITAMFPLGPVFHGAGLNITVYSTGGQLNVGVMACREQLPDPWPLARGFERGIKSLLEVADAAT